MPRCPACKAGQARHMAIPLNKNGQRSTVARMSTIDSTKGKRGLALTVAAIGVVFGDIGTSPLYALRECFSPVHGIESSRDNVLGIVSLLFWCLSIIVC